MRYKAVQIPEGLAERVKQLISESPELGYSSVEGFVEDAVRRHVERVTKLVPFLRKGGDGRLKRKLFVTVFREDELEKVWSGSNVDDALAVALELLRALAEEDEPKLLGFLVSFNEEGKGNCKSAEVTAKA